MIFADAGRVMPVVLEHLYHTLPKDDPALADLRPYIVTLLRTAAPHENPAPSCTTVYRALSQREAGVLRMIARGMSNKHIAHALGITPETVKSHAKNIFVKLATCTRAQAVARADALRLLY
jgi:ATP/maltotriose-dependent transcriptional regulator MalT